MALKTRIRLLTFARVSLSALTVAVILSSAIIASATEAAPIPATSMMWQAIVSLLGLLCSIQTGIIVWLVGNQKEGFQRIGVLETGSAVRKELCEDRHRNHKRQDD